MNPIARALLGLAACTASIVSAAAAQGVRVDLLPPLGTEVRATLEVEGDVERAEGFLREGSAEGIVLAGDDDRQVYHIPAEILQGLEVSRGRNHARGALNGLLWGALGAGVVFGSAMALSGGEDGCDWFCSPGDRFVLGAVVGGIFGGPIGLVVGGVIGTDRWERVW